MARQDRQKYDARARAAEAVARQADINARRALADEATTPTTDTPYARAFLLMGA